MAHQHTTQPDQAFRRIAVVGFGLVGASFAAAVRAAYPDTRVLAVDIDERTLAEAVERGWATDGALPDDPAFERFVGDGCDLVVLATPVGAAERYFEDLARWDYRGIVTDTASTKARITALAERVLPHPENFVPGHPMAGSEVNGIEGARPDLFKGAHWILCPDADTPAEHFPRLHELVTSIGARVIALPREDHDKAVAVVSHVPHIMASSLVQLASRHADDQQALMRLAAGGFKDSTRIAAGSPELWCGIAFDNKDALSDGLDEIQGIIGAFADALASDDRAALTALLADAAAARRALPAAWVPSTERLLEVRIPMEDRPGVVAEVTTVTSSVGCNIQSIEIDHVTEDSAVLSLVLTDEGDIGQLSAQLINAGFSVSFSPLTAKEHTHVA
ncbi:MULTISPECIES: prephenate dehydrogenase/arogenate dehydrogenase family protein [Eggerthella]|uniref:Prephenate dehydrogenase n=1 Tax=Eggerthella lenta TaxID=84112 RepID=A0A369NU60_EGGLN|nr:MULTISPECIES: prephenate dehydrogenase/arogenate dehydrogenase family protein [Eggerthella]MDB1778518.1 prephenate dehydrogenase/arogenate dehydrogenase family protein [Eggerthella lenta]MDU5068652.1 prephenate dehydrogenase/arogenate dehydrogenase family protein [Eggerthella sp.]MDU5915923.1 prephenate dehydrogenase/arogenate dehydrogenase family protein [Eggerthella sp.]MVN49073.1 prephenate dehydrogenase/arogenate dehydrogenase family protein [Eggerthella lenta]RDB80790.1 prephenate dehy